jgi:hypothetical protein
MSWLLLMLNAQATTLSEMSNADRYLLLCESQVEALDDDWAKIWTLWTECETEADKRGHTDTLPHHRGNRVYADLEVRYGELHASDPIQFARIVLGTQAQNPDLALPFAHVTDAWMRLLNDPAERQNLANVRTVTVRVLPGDLSPEHRAQVEQILHRYIGDLGFKVPASDEAAAADSAILVFVEPTVSKLQDADLSAGKLAGWTTSLSSQPVRYKDLSRTGRPVSTQGRADLQTNDEARRAAIEQASEAFAQELLLQVIRHAFSDIPLPD